MNKLTLGASPIRCPHCGKPAVASASKGMWCGHCKNGRAAASISTKGDGHG